MIIPKIMCGMNPLNSFKIVEFLFSWKDVLQPMIDQEVEETKLLKC